MDRVQFLIDESTARVRVAVHAGLARTKFVAHQSARRAGAGQAVVVPVGSEAEFLAPIAATHIPGLDGKLRQRLGLLGVYTIGDLQKLSQRDLHRQFKQMGLRLYRLAMGEDGERVRPLWPPRAFEKAIVFEDEVADTGQIHEALRICAEGISLLLADRHEYSRSLALWVSAADGSTRFMHEKHPQPISDTRRILGAALRLLGRMAIGQPVTGVRMQASDLGSGSGLQLALLDLNDHGCGLPHERREALNKTIAYLGRRYGSAAVLPASAHCGPRRVSFWTDALGRVVDKPLTVTTDGRGTPVAFYWRGRERPVERILDRWREEDWAGNARRSTRTIYLVQTAYAPFAELIQSDSGWKLGRRFD